MAGLVQCKPWVQNISAHCHSVTVILFTYTLSVINKMCKVCVMLPFFIQYFDVLQEKDTRPDGRELVEFRPTILNVGQ